MSGGAGRRPAGGPREGGGRRGRDGRPGGERGGARPAGDSRRSGGPGHDDGGRARALAALVGVEHGRFAAEFLRADEAPFVRELALGVLRRRATLDAVHDAFGRRPIAGLHPVVRAAVRLGLYQLLFLDGIPPHALVSESVRLVNRHTLGREDQVFALRGYVNGVLRAVLRESHRVPEAADRGGASPAKRLHRQGRCVVFFSRAVFPDPRPGHGEDLAGYLAACHSHPRFLVERWLSRWGEAEATARLAAGNHPAPLALRPARHRTTAAALAASLAQAKIVSRIVERGPAGGAAPGAEDRDALLVPARAEGLFASRAWTDGLFSVQDIEQMAAAEVLDPRPGEVVWDACAAPGTKAAQLAERLAAFEAQAGPAVGAGPAGGRIVATDVSAARLSRLDAELARLGLAGRVDVATHDALGEAPPPGRPAGGFDAILLDAPCSNTAVLARRPEARWRLRPETFARLAERQRALIASVARHLRPGGRLVYSVCTFEPEETEAHGLQATASPLVWTATREELVGRADLAESLRRVRAEASARAPRPDAPAGAGPPAGEAAPQAPPPAAFDWSGAVWAEPSDALDPEPEGPRADGPG